MQKVEFLSQKRKLSGRLFISSIKGKRPCVLILHGWTSGQDRYYPLAEKLSQKGFTCLTYDMSGHGESEGDIKKITRESFLQDALAAYDYLSKLQNIDTTHISLVGSSFGSYIGALLTAKRNIKNLAIRVPADYPNEGFKDKPKFTTQDDKEIFKWRSEPKKFNATYALEALHNFTGNVLLVESEKDEIIPHQTIQNYADAVKDKKKLTYYLMKGAPHSLRHYPKFEEYDILLVDWLQKH